MAAFTMLVLTRSAEQLRDSLVYADAIRRGGELLHPHHLIFAPVVRSIYNFMGGMDASLDAVFAAQIHNALWSAVTLACFLAILIRLRVAGKIASLVTLGLLFSRGFWELSTQSTVYAAALGTVVVIVWRMVAHRGDAPTAGLVVTTGCLWALSCLYHQINVLFGVPIFVYLWLRFGRSGGRAWAAVAALAGSLTLAGYGALYVYSTAFPSLDGFVRYTVAYTDEVCWGSNCVPAPDEWGSLANLGWSGLLDASKSLAWNVIVLPDVLETLLGPLLGIGFIALAIGAWRRLPVSPSVRAFMCLCSSAVLVYGAFSTWWLPDYQHPFVTPTAFAMLLGGAMLSAVDRYWFSGGALLATHIALALTVALLAGRNLQGRVLPLHGGLGESYEEAKAVAALAGDKCEVIASYRVWSALRFYFNFGERARLAKADLVPFYLRTDDWRPRAAEPCRLMAVRLLSPGFSISGYRAETFDGRRRPLEWMAFASWLVGFNQDSESRECVRQPIRLLMAAGEPYLMVDGPKHAVTGPGEPLKALEVVLRSESPAVADEIRSVLALASERRVRAGDRLSTK